ncbi:hypothetical protein BH24ACT7_BH24ACT7_21030 [soil metagenome]
MESRADRARREARKLLAKRDEPEALWRDLGFGQPPDRTLDYVSKPLARLCVAWPANRGDVEAALRVIWLPSDYVWFEVARRVLPDYPPQLTDTTFVYLTEGGSAYHLFQDYDALRSGQEKAKSEGWNPKLIRPVPLKEARQTEGFDGELRTQCQKCPW